MSCCGDVQYCGECRAPLDATELERGGLCRSCTLVVQMRTGIVVDEDPDRRPYIWDLED